MSESLMLPTVPDGTAPSQNLRIRQWSPQTQAGHSGRLPRIALKMRTALKLLFILIPPKCGLEVLLRRPKPLLYTLAGAPLPGCRRREQPQALL